VPNPSAHTGIVYRFDFELLLDTIRVDQPGAFCTQSIQPCLPCAKHNDSVSRSRKPRSEERRKRTRADD
jgi:hypothetical protein